MFPEGVWASESAPEAADTGGDAEWRAVEAFQHLYEDVYVVVHLELGLFLFLFLFLFYFHLLHGFHYTDFWVKKWSASRQGPFNLRDRDRDREMFLFVCVCVFVHLATL